MKRHTCKEENRVVHLPCVVFSSSIKKVINEVNYVLNPYSLCGDVLHFLILYKVENCLCFPQFPCAHLRCYPNNEPTSLSFITAPVDIFLPHYPQHRCHSLLLFSSTYTILLFKHKRGAEIGELKQCYCCSFHRI